MDSVHWTMIIVYCVGVDRLGRWNFIKLFDEPRTESHIRVDRLGRWNLLGTIVWPFVTTAHIRVNRLGRWNSFHLNSNISFALSALSSYLNDKATFYHHFPKHMHSIQHEQDDIIIRIQRNSINPNNLQELLDWLHRIETTQLPKKRQFGSSKGLIQMADDFDAPLDDFQDYA